MREHLPLTYWVDLISMARGGARGALLLVENDQDRQFARQFADSNAQIVSATDAANVIKKVRERGVPGVAAIAACDCPDHDIFTPDRGSVMSMICATPALDKVIHELLGRDKATIASQGRSIDGSLLRAIACLSTNEDEIISNWKSGKLANDMLSQDGNAGPWNGASVCRSLAVLGNVESDRFKWTELSVSAMLRVAFEWRHFETTRMFWHMYTWHRRSRYVLLLEQRRREGLGVLLDQALWESDLRRFDEEKFFPLAIIKMDLDFFKNVNDKLGHSRGDEFLRDYFNAVEQISADYGGLAYRRGGDEVLVVVPQMADDKALTMAERIRQDVERRMSRLMQVAMTDNTEAQARSPTVSIGVSCAIDTNGIEEAVKMADIRQQEAKRRGRNRVVGAPMAAQG